ncbi:ubiquitin-like-conjugating enzyme ATG10 [Patella vulgata]|uniref:ubiquitin-like-conjugating enzyme ATG10 n=1 Tax=Patella vulgata TaxID=6465 RepID=UPI00217F35D8|nr:ubiquitin-like-conjugating enzyme ATG10 [Patella vulgata]
MAAGSISETEFNELVKKIIQISQANNDSWEIRKSPHDESIYLVKRQTVNISPEDQQNLTDTDRSDINSLESVSVEETNDPSCLQYVNPVKILTYDYHIVYSSSYSVPVLYFNVYQPSGQLVSLEDIWSLVPDIYQQQLHTDKWSILTQQIYWCLCWFISIKIKYKIKLSPFYLSMRETPGQVCSIMDLIIHEHPILGRPFYQLHPCLTAMMMKNIQTIGDERKNYLISWLSSVGPVVGLKLPLIYAQT